jgi:hypothetical protein
MLKPSIEAGQSTTRGDSSSMLWNQPTGPGEMDLDRAVVMESKNKQVGASRQFLDGTDGDFDSRSRLSNASVAADEAEVYPSKRMLQDSTGRLRK